MKTVVREFVKTIIQVNISRRGRIKRRG